MGRVRIRIGDKRVLGLVKAFLTAGILSEDGTARATITGTPQGGILSPLLANIALSGLDEHFARKWEALGPRWTRAKRRRAGEPAMRLIRYADDFVRHEAPHDRVEMKGLHLWPVAAGHRSWGQSEPGDAGEGGKQPRQRRDGSAPPDDSGPASETGRCNASEPVAKAPQSACRLQPGGCGSVSSARPPPGGRLRSRAKSSARRPHRRPAA
jgi:hypothetical protein